MILEEIFPKMPLSLVDDKNFFKLSVGILSSSNVVREEIAYAVLKHHDKPVDGNSPAYWDEIENEVNEQITAFRQRWGIE